MPAVTAGEAWFSEWGFTIEPRHEEEYRQVLQTLPRLGRLAPDQVSAACRFAGLRYSYGVVPFRFLPPSFAAFWIDVDWPRYMKDATALLECGTVEDDAVYRNFMRQLDDGRAHLMDYERLGLAHPQPAATPIGRVA